MSLSVSGSNSSLVAQLMKSMRGTNASGGGAGATQGPLSTAATSDTSGVPSSAMMAFLAQLSGSTSSGSATDGSATADNSAATVAGAGPAPVGHAHGGHHRHGGGRPDLTADTASAAGTTASSPSTSGETAPSSLVAAFTDAMLAPGGDPSEDASGSTETASTGAAASVATEGQLGAFRQAMRAYAAQSEDGSAA